MIATDIALTNGNVKVTTPLVAPTVKLQQLREELKVVYLDRSEAIDLIMVGLLAKMHVFLGGQPGTGKTELAKAVSDAISGTTFFHYLMTKTTVAEEVLGAPDLAELQKGKFVRDTEAMLGYNQDSCNLVPRKLEMPDSAGFLKWDLHRKWLLLKLLPGKDFRSRWH
jgi:MoxR-like ATPase